MRFKDGIGENRVQTFIGVVDVELLERVGVKVFESEDVQHGDDLGIAAALGADRIVHKRNEPVEQPGV